MNRLKTILAGLALSTIICTSVHAQVAIKTNLIPDATLSPTLGIEIGLGDQWSLDTFGSIAFWDGWNSAKTKHWLVKPELRYWLCQSFSGSFFGLHLFGAEFNVGNIDKNLTFLGNDFSTLKDLRYQGWGIGAGLSYGYAFALGQHWNLEAEVGAGYAYANYDIFSCFDCGRKEGDGSHNYIGPTKLALNLVYLF